MNAVLGFAGTAERLQRHDSARRRNAENAYDKQTEFRELTDKTRRDLEALLRGEEPLNQAQKEKADFRKLDAGQVKNIAVPLGKNMEETIEMWRNVRKDAYSETPPTTADYQLGSRASAKITAIELQLALHNRAKTLRDQMAAANFSSASSDARDGISIYSIQNQARNNGYQTEQWPLLNLSV